MSTSEASKLATPRGRRGKKAAIFAAKLLVSGVCFWYVSRQIDLNQVLSAIPLLDFRWTALAILIAMLEIPLVGLRWYKIVDSLGARPKQVTRIDIIAATAVGAFFAQVLPSVAGDGMRAWLLVRLGGHWRTAVTSVIIDRAVGLALLIALGFAILLLPSDLTGFEGYRHVVRGAYGMMILAGVLGLLLAPKIAVPLARWRYSRWLATLASDTHRVLLGPKGAAILSIGCLIHALTIVIVWLLGRAQGLALPLTDAAVLFAVMAAVLLMPISISGWGLRELAVVSLLGAHGVAPERALLFSVCFGLTGTAGCLPGALAWLAYPFAPIRRPPERGT